VAYAILFSFHPFPSVSAKPTGALHGIQKGLSGRVDFPSFRRWNFLLYRVEEFGKADPDSFVDLLPLASQPEVQSPGIIIRPFLRDQPLADERGYHPGGRAFLHGKDVMEFRQRGLSFSRDEMEDEKLGKREVQTERLLLLATAQGPGQLGDS
jgi:hypothetical protein